MIVRSPGDVTSLPAWGEWIEMASPGSQVAPRERLSPHGESGLKLICLLSKGLQSQSLPAWGEWIEMASPGSQVAPRERLSPHGESGLKFITGKWIERKG